MIAAISSTLRPRLFLTLMKSLLAGVCVSASRQRDRCRVNLKRPRQYKKA